MDEIEAELTAFGDPARNIRDDAFEALHDRVFPRGTHGELAWTVGVRIAPRVIELATRPEGAWAAILLLDLVAAARRGGHRKVLDAAAPLAIADFSAVAPAVRAALELARQLAIGGPMPSDEVITNAVDDAVPDENIAALPEHQK
ncbi:MAG TPA: hypothetical protein VFV99_23765 [Kofleriaceae bacterium]|nr:hypothetical protein [Kofleriaceae bacterium]